MKHHAPFEDRDKFIEDLKAKQNNLTWPARLIGGRAVYDLLGKGARNLTLVQKIAAWLIGLVFLGQGLVFLSIVRERGFVVVVVICLLCLAVGAKVFRNGFPRRGA